MTEEGLFPIMGDYMNDSRLIRCQLETLSTAALLARADSLALDIPPDLNRNFIIQEILEAEAELDVPQTEEKLEVVSHNSNRLPLELPRGYNETFIAVLPRDPIWAYVFWEIRFCDKEAKERVPSFSGYRLQVISLTGVDGKNDGSSFLVPVEKTDNAWYLCLPSGTDWCRVDLCEIVGGSLAPIVSSAPFRIPSGRPRLNNEAANAISSALQLSGVSKLHVSRNLEWSSRRPRRYEE